MTYLPTFDLYELTLRLGLEGHPHRAQHQHTLLAQLAVLDRPHIQEKAGESVDSGGDIISWHELVFLDHVSLLKQETILHPHRSNG
jgi:hypothetical protein